MKVIAAAVIVAGLVGALMFSTLFLVATPSSSGASNSEIQPSILALQTIPANYLSAYQHAATLCPGLSWTVLAAIGEVETAQADGGTDPAQVSPAGAQGPMQFLPATFAAFHLRGEDDINSIQDAADAAARFLCANGGGTSSTLASAVFAYNHLASYVADVLSWASRYANSGVVAAGSAAVAGGVAPISGIKVTSLMPVESGGPFSTGTFPFGQCTWWAAFNVPVSWSGNAWQWWANSPASRHAPAPAPGDIVVYDPNYPGSDGFGHVGVVIGVQSANEFEVSEMNFIALGVVDQRTSDDSYVLGFIEP